MGLHILLYGLLNTIVVSLHLLNSHAIAIEPPESCCIRNFELSEPWLKNLDSITSLAITDFIIIVVSFILSTTTAFLFSVLRLGNLGIRTSNSLKQKILVKFCNVSRF